MAFRRPAGRLFAQRVVHGAEISAAINDKQPGMDGKRRHTTKQVGYTAFAGDAVYP